MAKKGLKNKSKKVRTPKLSKTQEKAVKAIVQKENQKDIEDKLAYYSSGDSLTLFNSGVSAQADILQVIPNVSQTLADNGRIGDQLTTKYINIKGFVKLSLKTQAVSFANDPKISNVLVRLMVVSNKQANNWVLAQNQWSQVANGLLKKGGTTVGYTGVLSDNFADINRDLFTVHHDEQFYLTQDYAFLPTTTGTNSTIAIDARNSVKFFNIRLKVKNRVFKYDSNVGGGISPTNYGAFMVLGYSYLDGSSPDVVNTQIAMQYISTMMYEDA